MPKRLAEFDFHTRDPERFDKILDGGIWRVETGEFGIKNVESLRAALIYTAKGKGIKVRTKTIRDEKGEFAALVVQAYTDAEVRKLRTVEEPKAEEG